MGPNVPASFVGCPTRPGLASKRLKRASERSDASLQGRACRRAWAWAWASSPQGSRDHTSLLFNDIQVPHYSIIYSIPAPKPDNSRQIGDRPWCETLLLAMLPAPLDRLPFSLPLDLTKIRQRLRFTPVCVAFRGRKS